MLLNNFIAFIIFKFNSNFTSQIFSRPMQINLTNFDAFKLTKRRGNSALIHILPPTSQQGILVFLLLSSFYFTTCQEDNVNLFPFVLSSFEKRYGHFDHEDLELARDQAREMFFFGYVRVFTLPSIMWQRIDLEFRYRNYLEHAFPMDELDPIQVLSLLKIRQKSNRLLF